MENWPKSEVSRMWNIGHEVMALVCSCWSHIGYILIWNINLLPLVELKILPWTKILTLITWPKSKVSGPWNIGQIIALVSSCWSHRDTSSYEIQLATIKRSWDSTLDKNLNLVYGWMYRPTHVRTTPTLYAPGGPRPRGHKNYRFPSKPESLQSTILFILSIAAAILTQTNVMKISFLSIHFVVKLNWNRLSVCLHNVVSKWHRMTSCNFLLLTSLVCYITLGYIKIETRSIFGQLICALFLSSK